MTDETGPDSGEHKDIIEKALRFPDGLPETVRWYVANECFWRPLLPDARRPR